MSALICLGLIGAGVIARIVTRTRAAGRKLDGLVNQKDLPDWSEFLNPQPDPPTDDVDAGLAALEDYANREGR